MEQADVHERFAGWRQRLARPAWKPIVRAAGAETLSRFGGLPSLAASEAWPTCGSCGDALKFFFQLEIAALPAAAAAVGSLLQLFSCSRDDGSCETWRPFSGTQLVRMCEGSVASVAHPSQQVYPVRFIDGWTALTDTPDRAEHERLGLAYDRDSDAAQVTVRSEDPPLEVSTSLAVAEAISVAAAGDKLRGWPRWTQGVEYPACTTCGERMSLLFQLDSEDNVPFLFGDVGCGHVTQCPAHPDVLAFAWACR